MSTATTAAATSDAVPENATVSRVVPPSSLARRLLAQYTDFSSFRLGQESSLSTLVAGQSTLSILPTSAGKSLVYQLAAKYYRQQFPDRVVLVVSPLLSLMQDQLKCIPDFLRATYVGTGQSHLAETAFWERSCDIVYMSPEKCNRLFGDGFMQAVSLVVFDEAHCVVEDGSTFRPDYLSLARKLRAHNDRTPIAAFTATLLPSDESRLIASLFLTRPAVVRVPMDRTNLYYTVQARDHAGVDHTSVVTQLCRHISRSGRTIVYCTTRKDCEKVAQRLGARGILSYVYHAGKSIRERAIATQLFVSAPGTCMVATLSFGMGVNVPDVRTVVHLGIPKTLAQYVQETGRAGRDGLPSRCLLLYHAVDSAKVMRMLSSCSERRAFQATARFVHAQGRCRREYLLSAFHQSPLPCASRSARECCDVCARGSAPVGTTSASTAQGDERRAAARTDTISPGDVALVLRAVVETQQAYGAQFPILYLLGSSQKKVKLFRDRRQATMIGTDSVYGHGKTRPKSHWKTIHSSAVSRQLLRVHTTPSGWSVYKLTQAGREFLRHTTAICAH